MSPGAEKIVAVVGAAAWLPQIGQWLYALLVRPGVVVVPAPNVELGFTELGPIVNLTVAISSRRKDALIRSATLRVQHADGDTIGMRWKWLNEKKAEISGIPALPATLTIQAQDPAIALKVATKEVVSRKINFQEVAYEDEHRKRSVLLVEQYNYVKAQRRPFAEFVGSREFADDVEWARHQMRWRAGRYTVEIVLALEGIRALYRQRFGWTISNPEFELMCRNAERMEGHVRGLFVADYRANVGEVPPDLGGAAVTDWNWISPRTESS